MKCLNIHSCNSKVLEDFFRLKMEMDTREEKHNDNKKENEKDVKKTYKNNINDIIIVWLKNCSKKYYLYIVNGVLYLGREK